MSDLTEALDAKNQSILQGCSLTIAPDGIDDQGAVTYKLTLQSPSSVEDVATEQSSADVGTAVTEFTAWVTAKWVTA